jgi:hypothetical protein
MRMGIDLLAIVSNPEVPERIPECPEGWGPPPDLRV